MADVGSQIVESPTNRPIVIFVFYALHGEVDKTDLGEDGWIYIESGVGEITKGTEPI